MTRVQEQDWYKKAEANYNRMAAEWNKLPGSKLYKDKDRFKITYCYHKLENRTLEQSKKGYQYCSGCGYPIPHAYDAL